MEHKERSSDFRHPSASWPVKFVIICGGGASGIGKGVTTSSIALLCKEAGYRVTVIKVDPYLNVDAGTMNPYEHGETFVLDDGGEADLDLGNYERFLDINLTKEHNITTGRVYLNVLTKERDGKYNGKTVQVVPHIIDEIINLIRNVSVIPVDGSGLCPDICFLELGGTVGDIENGPFLEALRQMDHFSPPGTCVVFFVSYVPVLGTVMEQKTKPLQHGVRELLSSGLSPDFIVCRSKEPLSHVARTKVSLFANLKHDNYVFSIPDVSTTFRVPLTLQEQDLLPLLAKKLKVEPRRAELQHWSEKVKRYEEVKFSKELQSVTIAIVGKYIGLTDAYASLVKALETAAVFHRVRLDLKWVEAEALEKENDEETILNHGASASVVLNRREAWEIVHKAHGILVPGGFGVRGIEGMIKAIHYARENRLPFFGICLGMQLSVIEFCRNVLGISDATSQEFDHLDIHPHAVVLVDKTGMITQIGGTLRLGSFTTVVKSGTLTERIYGGTEITERHRHRYEINPKFKQDLEEKGMVFAGHDKSAGLLEIIEVQDHPFFFACQSHPEFKSRFAKPSPPFIGFIAAAMKVHQVTSPPV